VNEALHGKKVLTNISTILFDFDGTIRHSVPRGIDVFLQHVQDRGVRFDHEQRRAGERWMHYYWAMSPELMDDLSKYGGIEKEDFWQQYARRQLELLGADGGNVDSLAVEITTKMREEYEPQDYVPEDVRPTLTDLRQREFRLGLVSNRTNPMTDLLEELNLIHEFDFTLASGEVGWYKPDPQLFHHVLEQLDTRADRAVYVGDNYYADVIGARGAGLQPILMDPSSLWPNPDCPVIGSVSDLLPLLDGQI
jgi:HAD superfamily hydrolase (TIGR01549 family)